LGRRSFVILIAGVAKGEHGCTLARQHPEQPQQGNRRRSRGADSAQPVAYTDDQPGDE
jgi:hypothetical protein